jgi:rubrerythrin
MDIFKFAIQMERDAQQYYQELASKTTHKGIRSVLDTLIADELRHQHILEQIQEGAGVIVETEALDKAKNVFQQMKDFGGEVDLSGDEESLYRHAIELEQKSVSFYLDRADQVETPEQQALFKKLAEEEKKHGHLLQCLLDFFASPKTWLEDAEFDRLDEY